MSHINVKLIRQQWFMMNLGITAACVLGQIVTLASSWSVYYVGWHYSCLLPLVPLKQFPLM
jgi:hypothetical protein